MDQRSSVRVRAGIVREIIELFVAGYLTETASPLLASRVTKARRFAPAAPIDVDLTGVWYVGPGALAMLRHQVDTLREADVEHRCAG